MRHIKTFLTLPRHEQRLFFEAFVWLGVMRAAILTRSFKRLTQAMECFDAASQPDVCVADISARTTVARVSRAIARAAVHTPWQSACLVQALAASKMLQKRGISGLLYLGIAKDATQKEKMKAHAWTRCADAIVTGKSGHEAFTALSVFKWQA